MDGKQYFVEIPALLANNLRPLPKSFQRATGFAEQMDIHEPTATVRESLRFSALLRQPREVPLQEKYDYCEKVIDLLEMRSIAGATVGSAGSGLNQEQRKRLTIAVELASKPELLLFLDEPTSGLDSLAAFNIVRFLRRLADAGQAVLCTIHQPSAVLFENFDELLLLQSGGKVVYNGPLGNDSKTLIDFFEKNGGKKCSPHANPAEVCDLRIMLIYSSNSLASTCWKSLEPEIRITRDRIGAMCGPTRRNPNSFLKT
jgi:ABC-type multidrug transport system ATPase subunit